MFLVELIETQQSIEMVVETDNVNFKKCIKFINPINRNRGICCLVQVDFNDAKKYIVIGDYNRNF